MDSVRIPGIPLLPGTTFRSNSKTFFPRYQHFIHHNGVPMPSEDKRRDHRGKIVEGFKKIYPAGCEPKWPGWLTFDKQILCFHAYFKEALPEIRPAPYLVRHVRIYYYLEDDTIQVVEPQIGNSGIPQGCLVARQRIPQSPPCHSDYITVLDLNVNRTVCIYNRYYHITGCDQFTRDFLNRAGIAVPDSMPNPLDPYSEWRRQKFSSTPTKKPTTTIDTLGQFLAFDRQVLKFDAYWNDQSDFGQLRKLELYFFLADDTIEIKEIFEPGRDGPSIFLKRGLVPKEWKGFPLPGGNAQPTVLNVLTDPYKQSSRFVVDSLVRSNRNEDCYKDNDLSIGVHLNIYGRDIVLVDCDEFTKEYYNKKYGIEIFNRVPYPQKSTRSQPRERELPPFNGWGSHADSEGNCKSVELKPPQIDMEKFFKYDRYVLRFGAKMISKISENCDRVFIISYYLGNDTLSIYELPCRNSGFRGGEFFKRDTFYVPDQEWLTSKRPDIYKAYHFYIGAVRKLRDHIFRIVSADEFTLMYMEHHPADFPLADIQSIMTKVREALRPNYKNFINKYLNGVCTTDIDGEQILTICFDNVRNALIELLGDNITEHEIITIARRFSAEKKHPPSCKRERVRSAAQLVIRRGLWDSLERLKETLYHFDPERRGFLPETRVRSIILGIRLPFNAEMTNNVLSVLNRNPEGEIDLCDFLSFIDVKANPAAAIEPLNAAFELCPDVPFAMSGRLVHWDQLIDCIGLEATLCNGGE